MPFTSCRDGRNTAFYLQGKKDMRQASSDDHEGPHESLGTKIENTQSNHLTPLSLIAGAGEDGKGRRSARSAFFFPDSRRLIPALPKFCSLYYPFHAFFPPFGFSTVKEASAEEREYLYSC